MFTFFSILIWLAGTNAHISAFHKGMYCLNGSQPGVVNLNANAMVDPLYQLSKEDWWFHHVNGCDKILPADGDFLELPAGGTIVVELANNQAFTTLSYGGKFATDWPNGAKELNIGVDNTDCITNPNIHTQNNSMAAGTSFAIAYTDTTDLSQVTIEELIVFSVAYFTPFKRLTTYHIPAEMPPCPKNGCICSWNWIPNGCGQPNMYMQGYRCKVTNSISTTPLAKPQPPVWCEDAPNNCTKGAKQIMAWNQLSGNNIKVTGNDLSGHPKSPAYNLKCGFSDGAQNDIFVSSGSSKREDNDYNSSPEASERDIPAAARSISSHRRNSRSSRFAARNLIPQW